MHALACSPRRAPAFDRHDEWLTTLPLLDIILRMNRNQLTRSLLASIILALTAGACRNMPPVRFPVTIQQSTPLPSATSAPPPTLTASPSPTPLPQDVVKLAERELRNGDWEAAEEAFSRVVDDPAVGADEQVAAYLGLAYTLLRQGDFAGAHTALDSLLARYPSHPRIPQAYFLRGDARLGLSNWGSAIEDFNIYLSLRPGLIDSFVHERIADAYLAMGMNDQAFAAYEAAIAADRYMLGLLQLREKVGIIYRQSGNNDGAIAQYEAILTVAQNAGYRAQIDFRIGYTYLEAGALDAYYEQMAYVFMTYPDSREALDALRALREANIPVDQYQRGVVNFNQGQYDIALEAFYNYLAETPIGEYRPEAYLYIARAYRELGNPQSAIMELQAMLNRFGPQHGSAWGDGWLEVASTYAVMGDTATAFATYEGFVADNPTQSQAPTALYAAAQLAKSVNEMGRAMGYLDRLAAEYPSDPRASEGMYRLGVAFYQGGDYPTAVSLFEKASAQSANERPAASSFWLGKTQKALDQTDQANVALNNAAALEPGSYYGLRAQDILSGEEAFAPPQSPLNLPASDAARVEAEQWLVQRFGLVETPPLAAALRADITSNPQFIRAQELWDLGLWVEARENFEAVRRAYQDDVLALYQLAVYFRDIGLYRSSLLAAARLLTLADTTPLDAPVFLARLRYPVYYDDLILDHAARYNLDPLWVYALIWQESQFEGFAVSTAAAQGLMQIWPPTGEDIAARLAWPDYRPSDLQRPMVSVAFGTWLLREELNRFDGSAYAALTAYNAGPGRTAEWVEASAGDLDLFVEVISLQEPRTYVQRIIEHYEFYRALYGTP